jgi:hypothetical protein
MPQAIPIRSSKDIHYGNILFSGGPDSGACILMLLPKGTEAFRDPEYQFLEQYGYQMAGEHRWRRANDNQILLSLSKGALATIDLDSELLSFGSDRVYPIKDLKAPVTTDSSI